jgi:nucleotide-binding universal stress UspA family protein
MVGHITHILVPTDFGPASDAALAIARNLAGQYGARLSMLHVLTSPEATGVWTPEVFMPASTEARERLTREAQERIESSLTAEDRMRSDVTIQIRIGSVAEHILDFAREHSVELIVMGTHGRRGLSHLLLGSVAEQVLRSAPCPVLTTRAEVEVETAVGAESVAADTAVLIPSYDRRKVDEVC